VLEVPCRAGGVLAEYSQGKESGDEFMAFLLGIAGNDPTTERRCGSLSSKRWEY
jgi:hypothetical protein